MTTLNKKIQNVLLFSVLALTFSACLKENTEPTIEKKSPLILVNGKEFKDLNSIKTDSVQSMHILKDKASTASYGKKGENGVILITTK